MFSQTLEVTRPTSQHFRNAISRICNASWLLLHLCGVTPGNPGDSVRDVSRFSFCDFQKHIMFLAIMEVTPPTSQHFRNAISRICNASRLLLHFCGVTPGNPRDSVRDLSLAFRVFGFCDFHEHTMFCIDSGGNPTYLLALLERDFKNV